ncbi:hypothetical protein BN1708_005007 [Verticillium longisporum]|uniref:Uncharacterized protein n=1 Tax=Verticillium longisporum TaxID=100787 RepID=A0A0G4M5L7_VERLO|nr:hypothetical protein BN1708_005007 [Verticillium longisporum]
MDWRSQNWPSPRRIFAQGEDELYEGSPGEASVLCKVDVGVEAAREPSKYDSQRRNHVKS